MLPLTESTGLTVEDIGDEATTVNLRAAWLYPGADWNEAGTGINDVCTCIATGEALTVHQTDHFDANHISLSCTVTPIFDPTGILSAVLNISALQSPRDN